MSATDLTLEHYRLLDATALAAEIRDRGISPDAIRELAIEAVAAHPAAHAAVLDYTPAASAESTDGFSPPAAGKPAISHTPFAGVPTFRKDLGAGIAGLPTNGGSAVGSPVVPLTTDPYWLALSQAGVTSLGRSRSAEFGALLTIEPPDSPAVQNPHAHSRTAGGSSGGAAALVAAGAVPFAHANDAGGSIRIPAAYTGTIGYKPARRTSLSRRQLAMSPPRPQEPRDLVSEFAITRSLRDTRALAHVLGTGRSDGKAGRAEQPTRPRIGVDVSAWAGGEVHPDAVAATEQAAVQLESAGYTLVPVALAGALNWAAFGAALLDTFAWLTARSFEEAALTDWDHDFATLQPGTRLWANHGRTLGDTELNAAEQIFAHASKELTAATSGLSFLLTPATAQPARPLGDLTGAGFVTASDFSAHMERVTQYSTIFNVTGHAAIALPFGRTAGPEQLPLSVQLVALTRGEPALFDAAASLIGEAPLPPAAIPSAGNWPDPTERAPHAEHVS